eukprot:tig00001224_g7633.t1
MGVIRSFYTFSALRGRSTCLRLKYDFPRADAHREFLRRRRMHDFRPPAALSAEGRHAVLDGDVSVHGLVKKIRAGKVRRIVVLSGAGVSTAAGIPDFRSPGSGLYDNLHKYDLPEPEAIFDLNYFRARPEPFFALAKDLYPGNYIPTTSHYFVRLLAEKGLLLRNYTQNIDTLERVAGIEPELLVEAHGSFAGARCIDCRLPYDTEFMRAEVMAGKIPRCPDCKGLAKPSIVFFGEGLPPRFFQLCDKDLAECDCLLVMGTSLQVMPVAELPARCSPYAPRLLVNRETVGTLAQIPDGFRFGMADNYRDVRMMGSTDDCVRKLCHMLGWDEDLDDVIERGRREAKKNAHHLRGES